MVNPIELIIAIISMENKAISVRSNHFIVSVIRFHCVMPLKRDSITSEVTVAKGCLSARHSKIIINNVTISCINIHIIHIDICNTQITISNIEFPG